MHLRRDAWDDLCHLCREVVFAKAIRAICVMELVSGKVICAMCGVKLVCSKAMYAICAASLRLKR